MPFKDILIPIDDTKSYPTRLQAAITLARAHNAQLTGLYILPYYETLFYASAYIEMELLREEQEEAKARAKEREAEFRATTESTGLTAEWIFVKGEPIHQLITHARRHDLVIIGQADPQDPYSMGIGFASQMVLGGGRPVLIIPYIGPASTLGERIMVAWNGSREAVRAVNDALPLLARAKRVNVITINPPGEENEISNADICHHLNRHGIQTTTTYLPATDIEVGDALLSRAADDNIDLIIMGAYGHSRMREIVLGGATRHLLKFMTVPILMSH